MSTGIVELNLNYRAVYVAHPMESTTPFHIYIGLEKNAGVRSPLHFIRLAHGERLWCPILHCDQWRRRIAIPNIDSIYMQKYLETGFRFEYIAKSIHLVSTEYARNFLVLLNPSE